MYMNQTAYFHVLPEDNENQLPKMMIIIIALGLIHPFDFFQRFSATDDETSHS